MENQEASISSENEIREIIKALVEKMDFVCEVEMTDSKNCDEAAVVYNIKTDESSFLIGQYGVNLQALQHLARILVRKKTNQKSNFILDVNSYRQEKDSSLVKLAHEMSEQAVREGRAAVLCPMSPYERRIIHLELSKDDRVETESIGEGEDRKVIIKPKNMI